jgi:MFS family permease
VIGVGVAAGASGLGIGIGSVAATDMGTAVCEAIKGTAAGVLNTAAQLGTAIGTALILLVATTFQPRTAWAVVVVFASLAATTAAARAPATATSEHWSAQTARYNDIGRRSPRRRNLITACRQRVKGSPTGTSVKGCRCGG